MESPTLAGIVGAVVLGLLGWIGKSAATVLRGRARRREITTAGDTEIARAREARPWALMEERIDDLEAALERVSASSDRKQELIDRLREERDKLRIELVDCQIEVRKANGALARVIEVQQQCEDERKQHEKIVARLSAEIRRLRGDH